MAALRKVIITFAQLTYPTCVKNVFECTVLYCLMYISFDEAKLINKNLKKQSKCTHTFP